MLLKYRSEDKAAKKERLVKRKRGIQSPEILGYLIRNPKSATDPTLVRKTAKIVETMSRHGGRDERSRFSWAQYSAGIWVSSFVDKDQIYHGCTLLLHNKGKLEAHGVVVYNADSHQGFSSNEASSMFCRGSLKLSTWPLRGFWIR